MERRYLYIPNDYFESKDYTIQNPEPADLDPNDGKQEIIISISAKNGISISSSSGEAFISFYLKTKEDSLNKQTSIEVLPAMTLLVNHTGESIQSLTQHQQISSFLCRKAFSLLRGQCDLTFYHSFRFK